MRHKSYRPSNGSEGDWFEQKWCHDCKQIDIDPHGGCPIWNAALCLSTDDENYPKELTFAKSGAPICEAYKAANGEGGYPSTVFRCEETQDMFRG